jgi:molybdopterin-binding protein
MLRVRNLGKRLGAFAIRDVSFDVGDGEYFVLLGSSGVGKTVLLESLAGLTPPDDGRILWNDEDITRTRIQERRLGLVYQDQALFPHMTVSQNLAYALRARRRSRGFVRMKVHEVAEQVGVTGLLDRYPATLSGGEAQRVALGRALAAEPRCLLLDEPISALDAAARAQMRSLLRVLHRRGHTILHVTHDYEEALSLASHVGIMENGTITEYGTPHEVFHHPKSEFVARFVGIRNFLKGRLEPPEDGAGNMARFVANGLIFQVLSDAPPGPGCLMVRSEDIAIARSRAESSAQNQFEGTVRDIARARLGVEVTVDIGVEIAAVVTDPSIQRLALECGQTVWVSFKAAAARFVEE